MKKISVRGTLGDCYTACLKLLKEEDIHIFHYTAHKNFYNEIKEIYSLFHNIRKVEFIEFLFPESKEVSGVPEDGMIWFPELDLPYLPICGEEYIVICPHTGREDAMARKIPMETINRMIELLDPIPVVLIGTDKRYKDIKCYKNLINKTTITEATSLIIDSWGFAGPEGYPCFVALSHKIPSVIFWVRWQPVQARLIGTPWQKYIIDMIEIRS